LGCSVFARPERNVLTAATTKLILIIVDGLTPSMFETAASSRETPTLSLLAETGSYRRAASVFPSLTPVCISSIATGAYPDLHRIPHLVWYSREEERIVEYGSSFGAIRAAGTRRSIVDAIFKMNADHLSSHAVTLFEAIEDAGLTPGAINIPCYRGRTNHTPTVPGLGRTADGPRRFFYYSLFESDRTGAPLAIRNRAGGTVDDYAAAAGRWLVTRDGFDFLAYYLSDYDYLSHARGPDDVREGLERTDRAVGALVEAAGGFEEFVERYALLLCSDHGQTPVERSVRLERVLHGINGVVVTASNRAAMVYRLEGCPLDTRTLAETLEQDKSVEAVCFLEDSDAVLRREGEDVRVSPVSDGWRARGDETLLDYPDARARVWHALQNPNAGDVLVSAAAGVEFADLGGRDHAGGGSHGSLAAGDSEVPVLKLGIEGEPRSITDIAALVLGHFGIEAPPYAQVLAHAH
jgi:predicted AlkP superfamily pyrophosphatase or phosphodiesterase